MSLLKLNRLGIKSFLLDQSFFKQFPDATALYGTQNLNDPKSAVLRARRSIDNAERDFTAKELETQAVDWAKFSNARLPLDINKADAIGAYSLRALEEDYEGAVARVRRASDNAERDVTADEVVDGTLKDFAVSPEVQALFGERMYFDGVDDAVTVGSALIPLSADFEVSYKTILPAGYTSAVNRFPVSQHLTAGAGRFAIGVTTSGQSYVFLGGNTITGVSLADGEVHEVKVTRVGSTFTLFVDNVSQGTLTFSGSLSDTPTGLGVVQDINRFFIGSFWDVNINNQHFYQGYGNTNADWEDQIGSANGTVVGSPELFNGQGFNGFVTTVYDQRVSTAQDRMYFTGGANGVNVDGVVPLLDGAKKITTECKFYLDADSLVGSITRPLFFVSKTVNDLDRLSYTIRLSTDNRISISARANPSNDVLTLERPNALTEGFYTVKATADFENNQLFLQLNDETPLVQNVTFGQSSYSDDEGTANIGVDIIERGLVGTIYDVTISKDDIPIAEWQGYGNRNSDWLDQIGSVNGTIVGNARRCLPDLSAISRDITQATAGSQPKIVDNGALILENGRPVIDFDGDDDSLNFNGAVSGTQVSVYYVFKNKTLINNERPIHINRGTNDALFMIRGTTDTTGAAVRYLTASSSSNGLRISQSEWVNNTHYVFSLTASSSESSDELKHNFKNNTGRNNSTSGLGGNVGVSIGMRRNGSMHASIKFQELVVYNSALTSSTPEFSANQNNYYLATDNIQGFVPTVYDQSDEGNDASQSTASLQPRIVEDGALLDINDKATWSHITRALRIPKSPSLNFTDKLSVIAVVKNNKSNITSNEYVFSQYDSGTDDRSWAMIYRSTNNRFAVFFGSATGTFQGGYEITDGTFDSSIPHIIGFTFDSGTVKMFVDGVERTNALVSGSAVQSTLFSSTKDYTIGSSLGGDTLLAIFDGKINFATAIPEIIDMEKAMAILNKIYKVY